MINLAPCPHCDGEAAFGYVKRRRVFARLRFPYATVFPYVYCTVCGCRTRVQCDDSTAADIWNRRGYSKKADAAITLPFPVGTTVWSAKPFKDNICRKGHVTAFVIDSNTVCSFYVSFEDQPVSCEFLIDDIGNEVTLSQPQ